MEIPFRKPISTLTLANWTDPDSLIKNVEDASQDVSKTQSILFAVKFEPFSKLFKGRHDEFTE